VIVAILIASIAFAQLHCKLDWETNTLSCPGPFKKHPPPPPPPSGYLTDSAGEVLTTNAGDRLLAR
jgi:hypothetical protein